jgi:hypothetical protein
MRLECVTCGLAPCDLPDGVDPELIFVTENGLTHCQGCAGGGITVAFSGSEPPWHDDLREDA